MAKGKLYLIPTTLGSETTQHVIPAEVAAFAIQLRHFAVEEIKTARRYLRKLDREFPIDDSQFFVINKRSILEEVMPIIKVLESGVDVGIISEAGCPGIADPGAELVAVAHQHGIHVHPFVGPSSILLTLISSGFNGQEFAFHGYLPIEKKARAGAIKRLESLALKSNQTQIFMETPYRNEKMLAELLRSCHPDTRLCIAKNITGSSEWIRTASVGYWKKNVPKIHKEPAIFLLGR